MFNTKICFFPDYPARRYIPMFAVIVSLKAAGGAPQLVDAKKKIKIEGSKEFRVVKDHVYKMLKDKIKGSLFLYVSSAHISPSLDQTLSTLALSFGRQTAKALILDVTYCINEAWG
eukprot:m.125826 g.125826  ORF g.125826 m.125826 type:complete len:116 (-) comp17342_c0_seq4:207-554(-)